jgi:hypothetical protein
MWDDASFMRKLAMEIQELLGTAQVDPEPEGQDQARKAILQGVCRWFFFPTLIQDLSCKGSSLDFKPLFELMS